MPIMIMSHTRVAHDGVSEGSTNTYIHTYTHDIHDIHTHSLTYSLTHSPTHPLTHRPTHSLTHSLIKLFITRSTHVAPYHCFAPLLRESGESRVGPEEVIVTGARY